MLLSYAQDAGAHGHALDDLSRLHLGHAVVGMDAVTGTGRGRLGLAQVPPERAASHVAEAADCLLRLWHALRPRLADAGSTALYEQVERRLIPDPGRYGARTACGWTRQELRRLSADFGERMAGGGDRNPQAGRSSRSISAAPRCWGKSCSTR